MNQFKKLAGQTAIYGLGTMVPRLLNYLLTPLYVRVFVASVYGQFTELYAYIALLMALLTYGMETTFFRFGKGENYRKVYGNIMSSILATTLIFVVLLVCFHPLAADAINYHGKGVYLLLTGLIVALDVIAAVPFCVLRQQDKAKKFSLIKIANVCTNVGCNILFLLVIPETATHWANSLFGEEAGLLTWVFVSNLIASGLNLVLLLPQLKQIELQWDKVLMNKLLRYSLPIMLISLIGMVNEVADKLAIRYMSGSREEALAQLGIYGANYKLAVLMTIFVQMFRYASEPFFFSKAEDRNSPQLFADVMKYFIICGLIIFLGVTLYIDLFGYFLGNQGSEYRDGLGIIPIVLIANLFLGIVFNLSIWYKLSDRTSSGTVITAMGAIVTLGCLFILVPFIGYWGAAIAHISCYTVMMIISYIWGQKVYPIPYNVKRCGFYFVLALALYFISNTFKPSNTLLMYACNTIYLLIFCGVAYKLDLKHAIRN